jgi:MFS family permease
MNRSLSALQNRPYLFIWLGSLLSNIGNWVQNVAESWVVAHQTHSPFLVELISFAQFIPVIFLVIPAGVLADRFNKKTVLLCAQTAMCLVAITLSYFAHHQLITPTFLIIMTFIEGASWSLGGPAWHTVIPQLVPRKDLESAISLNSIQYNLARLIGPAIAGIVIAKWGIPWAFDINIISFLAVLLAIIFVPIPKTQKSSPDEILTKPKFSEGWMWIKKHRGAKRIIVSISLFAIFSAPIQGLLPLFATDIFHVDAKGLGTLLSCLGAGAVTGAYLLGLLPTNYPRHHLIPLSMTSLGLLVLIYSEMKSFKVACAVMFITGIFWLWSMVSCNTAMQLLVPDRLRGRVMSVLLTAHVGMLPIGHIIAGALAEKIGATTTMMVCAFSLLTVGIVTLFRRVPEIDGVSYKPQKINFSNFISDAILATPYRTAQKNNDKPVSKT